MSLKLLLLLFTIISPSCGDPGIQALAPMIPGLMQGNCNENGCRSGLSAGVGGLCNVRNTIGNTVKKVACHKVLKWFTLTLGCHATKAVNKVHSGLCRAATDVASSACSCPGSMTMRGFTGQINNQINHQLRDLNSGQSLILNYVKDQIPMLQSINDKALMSKLELLQGQENILSGIKNLFPQLSETNQNILKTKIELLRNQEEIIDGQDSIISSIRKLSPELQSINNNTLKSKIALLHGQESIVSSVKDLIPELQSIDDNTLKSKLELLKGQKNLASSVQSLFPELANTNRNILIAKIQLLRKQDMILRSVANLYPKLSAIDRTIIRAKCELLGGQQNILSSIKRIYPAIEESVLEAKLELLNGQENLLQAIKNLNPKLDSLEEDIFQAQRTLTEGQKEILKDIGDLSLDIEDVKKEVQLNRIISGSGESVFSLETIHNKFKSIETDGQTSEFLQNFNLDQFKKAALDSFQGCKPSVGQVLSMLSGGSIFQRESIFKTLPEFCTQEAHDYFFGLVDRGMTQYKIALALDNIEISDNDIEDWTIKINKAREAFALHCRCPFPGTMFARHSEISSLLFKLPFTTDSFMENKEKVAVSDYDGVTRRKMILTMSLLNFEPNDEARNILQKTYMEDITTLLSLNQRNLLDFAEHFDNTGTCINKELNGITNALIVSGGYNGNILSSVEVFIPPSSSTFSLPPFPNGIYHHSQNGLLQCGGVGSLDSCHELTSGVWTKIHSLEERQDHASWRTNSGSLFLLGGFNHSMATTTMINDRRSSSDAGFVLRNKIRFACSIPDTTSVLITGGWSNGATDHVSRYDEGGWVADLPSLITARYYHGCAQYFTNMGTAVFIVMGGFNGGVLSSTEQYTERERRWRESTALPHALTGLRATTLDNLIYLTGGKDEEREYRDEIYQLDTMTNTWEEVGKMKTARGVHAISVINYRLVEEFTEC